MADELLSHEILALVEGGGERVKTKTKAKSKKHKERRRRHSSESDQSSSDDSSDSGSLASSDDEDDVSDGWRSDFMGDDKDREQLMSLPELEREQILSERAEKRQMRMEKLELRRKLRQSTAYRRSSGDSKRSRDKKHKDSFAALRKKREEKKKHSEDRDGSRRKKKKKRSSRHVSPDRSNGSDYHSHERKRKRARGRSRSPSSCSGKSKRKHHRHSRSDSNSDHGSRGRNSRNSESSSSSESRSNSADSTRSLSDDKLRRNRSYTHDKTTKSRRKTKKEEVKALEVLTLEDIQKVLLTRDQLEKWCFAPFFNNTVKRAFVKIRIGVDPKSGQSQYRLAQVIDVQQYKRTYVIQRQQTNMCLFLKHGKAEKQFLMDIVSNSPLTEAEFSRWKATCTYENIALITLREIAEKVKDIQRGVEHIVTKEEVNDMVFAKKQLRSAPRNLATERTMLYQERDAAATAGNAEDLERLNQSILELDELAKEQRERSRGSSVKLEALKQLNARNRRLNMTQGREAEQYIKQKAISDATTRANMSSPLVESTEQEEENTPSSSQEIGTTMPRSRYQEMFASLGQLVDLDI